MKKNYAFGVMMQALFQFSTLFQIHTSSANTAGPAACLIQHNTGMIRLTISSAKTLNFRRHFCKKRKPDYAGFLICLLIHINCGGCRSLCNKAMLPVTTMQQLHKYKRPSAKLPVPEDDFLMRLFCCPATMPKLCCWH